MVECQRAEAIGVASKADQPDQVVRPPVADVTAFNKAIIEATCDLVCAYKPNYAFYEAEGFDGLRALEATIAAVPDTGS